MNTRHAARLLAAAFLVAAPSLADASVYEVGPDHEFKTPDTVPWSRLSPGDEVRIHWRAEPYRTRWSFSLRGREDAPIVCRGVRGPDGQRPVIDAANAISPAGLSYKGGQRGIIKIGYSSVPQVNDPQWLVIEGLTLRGARPGRYSLGRVGLVEYKRNAAAIFIERGSNIVIRDCEFTDCGNGFFSAYETQNLLVENCYLHGNGGPKYYEHNAYTAGVNVTFRNNRFGPLREDCFGNAFKDRSANLRVIGNWIEGGNRQLDLVDGEDDISIVEADGYRETWVVGNVLAEVEDFGNTQVIHYGGDSGAEDEYRRKLHLWNNTVVSTRKGRVTLMRLSSQVQEADVRNNILYSTSPGGEIAILDETGGVTLSNNWIKEGFKGSHGTLAGRIEKSGNTLGEDPGFVDLANWDLRLRPDSPAAGIGATADWPEDLQPPIRVRGREEGTFFDLTEMKNAGALPILTKP